ncbi:MAG: PEP-CTERM system histidine kinase PrsK [Desulfuromonadaceae bacterium]
MLQLLLSSLAILTPVGFCVYLLLRTRWRWSVFGLVGGLLACVVLEFCDLQALLHPDALVVWKQAALAAEGALPLFWLLFALTFSREGGWRGISLPGKILLFISLGFPLAVFRLSLPEIFYSPDFADEKMLFLGTGGYLFYVALMTFLVMAMFHLERTLMALPRPDRWRVKFEVIGIGVLLAVLVVYYSQALLYRSLDMNLMPVRSISLVLAVALMVVSRQRRSEIVRIQVSREIAYRSVVILAVGCYLIGLGLFGTGMRYLGQAGNRVFILLLAMVCGLAVVAALLSERVRRRIRVVLHKHFYQHKYDYRQEWQAFTDKLAAAQNRVELERGSIEFYVETYALRGAALYLRDQDTGRFRCSATFEMDQEQLPDLPSHPLIEQMRQSDWIVSLEEEETTIRGTFPLPGAFFLVPLRFDQGLEGFVVLGQRIYEAEELTYEDYDLMKILAHQAISVLLSRKLYAQLVVANEMAAIGRVSTFVIHDLKNLVSGLSMVVDNARDYIDDPDFRQDMFETLENTTHNMKSLIARLQNVKQKPQLQLAEHNLLDLVKAGVALSGGAGTIVEGEIVTVLADGAEIQKVLLNLIHNAHEATSGDAPVRVQIGREDMAFVRVIDQGCGMSDEFIRNRLFKPFETTKKKGLGIGLYQCRQVIEDHGGRIEVQSAENEGTTFTFWLPLAGECRSPEVS